MSKIAMVVKTTCQPGKRDEVFALWEQLLAPRAQENEGQEVVVWASDQHDPDAFFLFEMYRDAAVMGANAQESWFSDYMQRVGPLLAHPPEVSMGEPVWVKGL